MQETWSDAAVALPSATKFRARALQQLVEACGCTFVVDGARPELLVVSGVSILKMADLAEVVMEP